LNGTGTYTVRLPPSRGKYKNVKVGGFASKREAARYQELKLMEKANLISDLRSQVCFELVPKQDGERAVKYIADMVYKDRLGNICVEDAKGFKTQVYIIKRKLMKFRHGISIIEV
jgi:hypothetical protein